MFHNIDIDINIPKYITYINWVDWKFNFKVIEDGPDVNFYQPERKEPETPYVVYR